MFRGRKSIGIFVASQSDSVTRHSPATVAGAAATNAETGLCRGRVAEDQAAHGWWLEVANFRVRDTRRRARIAERRSRVPLWDARLR
jgi:hypothetical protein